MAKTGFNPAPPESRFFPKVAMPDENGCMNWMAGTNGVGYGMFFVDWAKGRNLAVVAHRWSYQYFNGPISDGLHIDHLCRNTLCVAPDHLEAVTQRENTLRGTGIAAVHAKKTHCIHGHPLSGDNLIYRSNGRWRDCRQCRRDKDRRARARKKEKAS